MPSLRTKKEIPSAMNTMPRVALAEFKEDKRRINYVVDVKDVKDLNPVSCTNFVPNHEYDIKWQGSEGSFDGRYPGKILALAASKKELEAKIKKNKWKEPVNLATFVDGPQMTSTPAKQTQDSTEPLSNSRRRPSKQQKEAMMSSSLDRMKKVLDSVVVNKDSDELLDDTLEAEDAEEVVESKTGQGEEQDDEEGDDDEGDDEEDFDDENDDDAVEGKYLDLKKQFDRLNDAHNSLKSKHTYLEKLHSSCKITISTSSSLCNKAEARVRELEESMSAMKCKLSAIAVENVKLKKALIEKDNSHSVSPYAASISGERDTSRSSTNIFDDHLPSSVEESSSQPFDDSDDWLKDSNTSTKRKASDTLEDDVAAQGPKILKKKQMKDDQETIAKRVNDDITGLKRLEEKDGNVIFGSGIGIKAEYWKKKLRCADDNAFINRFPISLWKREDLAQRCFKGGVGTKTSKSPATPSKIDVIMGAFKGKLMADNVPESVRELRLEKAEKTLQRKFIDFSRAVAKSKKLEDGSDQ